MLCSAAESEPSEENVSKCEMKHFNNLTAPKLQAFIIARHPTFKTKASISHLKKPRTALKDAEEGKSNLLSVAFESRTYKSRVLVAAPGKENVQALQTMDDSPVIHSVSLDPKINDIKASQLILDPSWLRRLWSVVDSRERFSACVVDDELAKKGDLLLSLLHTRLGWHIKRRVTKLCNQDHWCLEWARRNLAVVAAYMVLLNHVKKDISLINESKCLLAKPNSSAASNYLFCTNSESLLQGCYLYFDSNEEEWIRSVKVTGANRHFEVRDKEHQKRAESDSNDDGSLFYDAYPSLKSKRAKSKIVDGYFENLQQFVGAGFQPMANVMAICQKDCSDGGVFLFTKDEVESIRRVNFRGRSKEENCMEMVGYLFELGYDLALSRKYNVSQSPGFEGCGLIFDRR